MNRKIVFSLLLISIFIGSVIVFYNIYSPHNTIRSTPAVFERVLLNGTINVDQGVYYIQFIIPKDAYNIKVSGNFKSTNGEIRVYVMNETTLSNLSMNSSPSGPNYDSGQTAAGDITATMTLGGTYYLIYDNHDPLPKTVATQVSLGYWL